VALDEERFHPVGPSPATSIFPVTTHRIRGAPWTWRRKALKKFMALPAFRMLTPKPWESPAQGGIQASPLTLDGRTAERIRGTFSGSVDSDLEAFPQRDPTPGTVVRQ